jgi:hypothetical protein
MTGVEQSDYPKCWNCGADLTENQPIKVQDASNSQDRVPICPICEMRYPKRE